MARESGISFTEFSYMLLQANDFCVLHREHGVRAAGGRLRPVGQHHRRASTWCGAAAARWCTGLTAPLIVRSDGSKFGKSRGRQRLALCGAHQRVCRCTSTSLNVPDDDVQPLLPAPHDAAGAGVPGGGRAARRPGQIAAQGSAGWREELTALVHGAAPFGRSSTPRRCCSAVAVEDADAATFELLAAEVALAPG